MRSRLLKATTGAAALILSIGALTPVRGVAASGRTEGNRKERVEWSASSVLGRVEVVRVIDPSTLALCGVRIDRRWLIEPEWVAIEVVHQIVVDDRAAILLLRFDTAGTACPYHFRILDLSGRDAVLTNVFGNCGSEFTVSECPDGLIVRIPAFIRLDAVNVTYASGKLRVQEEKRVSPKRRAPRAP